MKRSAAPGGRVAEAVLLQVGAAEHRTGEIPGHTPDVDGRIRECSADDCRLVYLDTSRSGTRRWCSMQRCGNRAKVRTFRAKASA